MEETKKKSQIKLYNLFISPFFFQRLEQFNQKWYMEQTGGYFSFPIYSQFFILQKYLNR